MKTTSNIADRAQRTAVVAGASGLVGRALLRQLSSQKGRLPYAERLALVRRPLAPAAPDVRGLLIDFAAAKPNLDAVSVAPGFDLFCCLGTTRARAGSAAEFQRVDRDLVLALGRWAHQAGARRMLVVSSVGADARSAGLYSRTKGEMEEGLARLGLASLVIVRPSLLVGERTEHRPAEAVALALARPFASWIPAAWRPVLAEDVAACLITQAVAADPPAIVSSSMIQGAAHAPAA